MYTELVVRQENQMFTILALHLHLMLHHVVVLLCILLLQTHLLDFLHRLWLQG